MTCNAALLPPTWGCARNYLGGTNRSLNALSENPSVGPPLTFCEVANLQRNQHEVTLVVARTTSTMAAMVNAGGDVVSVGQFYAAMYWGKWGPRRFSERLIMVPFLR